MTHYERTLHTPVEQGLLNSTKPPAFCRLASGDSSPFFTGIPPCSRDRRETAPCGQLPAPDLVRASVECANALLAVHRYCRHDVRFTDPAQDSIHQELATDAAGTDLDPALALSVALTRLGDKAGIERQRCGLSVAKTNKLCLGKKHHCRDQLWRRHKESPITQARSLIASKICQYYGAPEMATTSNFESIELCVAREDSGYVLALGNDVLVTSIGRHVMRHESPDLIQHTISEFERYPEITIKDGQIEEPAFLGAYRLFGLQREFIEPRTDNVTEAFAFELFTDPTLRPLAGPERRDIEARYGPLDLWLDEQGLRRVDTDFVDYDTIYVPEGIEYLQVSGGVGVEDTGEFHRLAEALQARFAALTPEERTCVVYLHNALRGALVQSLALVEGGLTPNDFAKGIGASQNMLYVFGGVSPDDHSTAFAEIRDYAIAALDYIAAYRSGTVGGRLRELLSSGRENTDLEFKSSLRWNLREGRKDREMTDAVVKTIAAFLNTQGGTLLIGVSDDRLPIGIEVDQFDNDDKFLLHLFQSAQNALGAAATALISTSLAESTAGQVCIVDCAKSPEPIICNTRKFRDAFFVRTGPRTENLEGEERANFVRSRWAG